MYCNTAANLFAYYGPQKSRYSSGDDDDDDPDMCCVVLLPPSDVVRDHMLGCVDADICMD